MREKEHTRLRLKLTGSLFYVVLRIGVNCGGIEREGVKEIINGHSLTPVYFLCERDELRSEVSKNVFTVQSENSNMSITAPKSPHYNFDFFVSIGNNINFKLKSHFSKAVPNTLGLEDLFCHGISNKYCQKYCKKMTFHCWRCSDLIGFFLYVRKRGAYCVLPVGSHSQGRHSAWEFWGAPWASHLEITLVICCIWSIEAVSKTRVLFLMLWLRQHSYS